MGFRVQSSRLRVQGSGFRVQGLGLMVQGPGLRVSLGFRVKGSDFGVCSLLTYYSSWLEASGPVIGI